MLKHEFLWCETTNFKNFFLNSAKHKRADFIDGQIEYTLPSSGKKHEIFQKVGLKMASVPEVNTNEMPRNFIFIVRWSSCNTKKWFSMISPKFKFHGASATPYPAYFLKGGGDSKKSSISHSGADQKILLGGVKFSNQIFIILAVLH